MTRIMVAADKNCLVSSSDFIMTRGNAVGVQHAQLRKKKREEK